MSNNDMVDISVEVESLNMEGIQKKLLNYVETNAKIAITQSVSLAQGAAQSAEVSADTATDAANEAVESARQASESLGRYYTKTETDTLFANKANKATTIAGYGITDAYTKTQVDSYLANKSDTSFSNLSADGQMVVDSANGTISNCILEIPQNIKLELSNNVLTAKAGCIFVLGGSTYSTTTNSSNLTLNIPTTQGRYVISPVGNYNLIAVDINKWGSGDTLPAQGTGTALRFFKTDERTFYSRGAVETEWGSSSVCYPICLIDVDSNGVASFVKFSDGRYCIFNGIGFIGQTKYILPNVKVLESIGKNVDGTLKSREYITDSLQLVTQGGTINRRMFLNHNTLQITASEWYYDEETNLWYEANGNPFVTGVSFLGNCFTTNDVVTDFTISQPIKLVSTEVTDVIQSQVNTNTTAIATKANDSDVVKLTGDQIIADIKTFTANPVISNTQPQTQFVDSDFSKGTVPVSALRNTFFVLRDATNLESGDMGSLYQRIDEYGNNYIAIVAFKNTSGSNDNAQMGIYYNTDGTSYATCPTPPAGDSSIKIATTKWVNDYFASITGYDATKTQTLKNVNGTLTWVDD